jgi:flagellar hook-associated protein 2
MANVSSTGLQITGLASNLDTNAIVQALLSDQTQRITNLTNQQNHYKALNTQLQSIQSSLRTLALNAQALGDPGLFHPGQTVTSSNSAIVSATGALGAGIGGYQVAVSQLAGSAQRAFTLASGSLAGDTITIDGHDTTLSSDASSIQDVVNAINSDPDATVYAASTDSGTVVFSSRQTGDTGSSFIQVSDSAGLLSQKLDAGGNPIAKEGKDAIFSVDGVQGSSSTNTVKDAIAGVTLTLGGVTSPDGSLNDGTPVTVVVGSPAASTSAIESAVTTFVNAYNSIIDQISGQITQKTSTSNPNLGLLFGDNELSGLLGDMRTAMYSPGAGLPNGPTSPADIGITTGATTGGSTFSADSVAGKLTVNKDVLDNAIATNPDGVKAMLQSWSSSFYQIVNAESGAGGGLATRIDGDNSQISDVGDRIDTLNEMLSNRQTALQAQFAALEATLAGYQSQNSWLASQINSLPLPAQLP